MLEEGIQLHTEDCCVTELLLVLMVLVEFEGEEEEGSVGIPISHEQQVAGEAFLFLPLLCYGNLFQHLLEGLGSPRQFWWERTGGML